MWGDSKLDCKLDYDGLPTDRTIVCTVVIVLFTVVLEFAVHGKLSTTSRSSEFCLHPNPAPHIRANRLIAAILLYTPVLTAFIMRVHDINDVYVRPACRQYVGNGINWWAVVSMNILPFIAASFSLIRTVVDCLLVRCGMGLESEVGSKENGVWTWTPCMPFYLVYVGVVGLFTFPIACLMGRPSNGIWSMPVTGAGIEEDLEMQSEETRGLVDDMEEEEEEEEEEGTDKPPTYGEVVGKKATVV